MQKMTQPMTIEQMFCTYLTAYRKYHVYLGHGFATPEDEIIYLLLFQLKQPVDLEITDLWLQQRLSARAIKGMLRLLERRVRERIPAAYLTHEAYFAGRSFYVDQRVLIPRSPLAELINERFAPWVTPQQADSVKRILEIGTGSGCIAISCAKVFPKAIVDAVDIDRKALTVAARNCVRHRVKSRVRLLRSNLFHQLAGRKYDIIISNPPYVGEKEFKKLPREYLVEPRGALVAGDAGDELVIKILQQATQYLRPQGWLFVEVGNSVELILQKFASLPLVWLEFACGESEVFGITREQLLAAGF